MFLQKVVRCVSVTVPRALPGQHVTQTRCMSSWPEAEASKPLPARYEKSINQVTLLGRVGGDPQKRGTPEHPVVVFSLATNTSALSESGEENVKRTQKPEWHRVCVFNPNLRDVVYQYMTKGQRVLVQGKISYADTRDENGEKVGSLTSIIANDITFISGARSQPED